MVPAPPVRRRLVGKALRRYRENLGYSLADVAAVLECDPSKVSRIETGQRGIRGKELRELLGEYGIAGEQLDILALLADPRGAFGWFRDYDDVLTGALKDYLVLESAATNVWAYEAQQVPALLQTRAYARALAETSPALDDDTARDRAADAVTARQHAILGEHRPDVRIVIGQAALHQQVGTPEVMNEQLRCLAHAAADSGTVTVQVLPFESGAHAAAGDGSLAILRLPHHSEEPTVRTSLPAATEQASPGLPGEVLTRRAVTGITAAIVAMAFAFSLGNVTQLCLNLGITAWIAWLVAPAVDLNVIGLLAGMRFLSLHGYTDAQLAGLQRMLRFCGLLTLALNTAGSLSHRQYGTALVDAVGPALLIGWSEAGPWLLRQIHAVCPPAAPPWPAAARQPEPVPAAGLPSLPARLLARAHELDAEHRAETGRPISRDALRARLRIGRDRAGALVAAVRAEAASRAGTAPLGQPA